MRVEFDMTSVTVVSGGMTPLLANPVDPDELSVVTDWVVDVMLTMPPMLEAAAEGRPVLAGLTVVISEV
jgi:hypothetical protein